MKTEFRNESNCHRHRHKKKEPRLVIEPGLPHNKEGGYLLSHIALQYHRRKRA